MKSYFVLQSYNTPSRLAVPNLNSKQTFFFKESFDLGDALWKSLIMTQVKKIDSPPFLAGLAI